MTECPIDETLVLQSLGSIPGYPKVKWCCTVGLEKLTKAWCRLPLSTESIQSDNLGGQRQISFPLADSACFDAICPLKTKDPAFQQSQRFVFPVVWLRWCPN